MSTCLTQKCCYLFFTTQFAWYVAYYLVSRKLAVMIYCKTCVLHPLILGLQLQVSIYQILKKKSCTSMVVVASWSVLVRECEVGQAKMSKGRDILL